MYATLQSKAQLLQKIIKHKEIVIIITKQRLLIQYLYQHKVIKLHLFTIYSILLLKYRGDKLYKILHLI